MKKSWKIRYYSYSSFSSFLTNWRYFSSSILWLKISRFMFVHIYGAIKILFRWLTKELKREVHFIWVVLDSIYCATKSVFFQRIINKEICKQHSKLYISILSSGLFEIFEIIIIALKNRQTVSEFNSCNLECYKIKSGKILNLFFIFGHKELLFVSLL